MRDGGVVTAATDTTAVDKGLRTGTLGLFGSVVMGISSTAPAYSLAASLGLVVASGGRCWRASRRRRSCSSRSSRCG